MKHRIPILMLLFVLIFSSVAQANVGTPLMWAGMFHLAIGNLFIGIFEGWLLSRFFKVSKGKAIGLMILANYISAWVGSILLYRVIIADLPIDIYNAWLYFLGLMGLAYLLTLVLEFPFVALTFRGDSGWCHKAIRGSLIVQTASYLILFGWYWLPSVTSLYTKTEVVELSSISLPEKVLLYYISDQDGDVYRRGLTDSKDTRIFDLNSKDSFDRLMVRPSQTEKGRWDLLARLEVKDHQHPEIVPIEKSFTAMAVSEKKIDNNNPTDMEGTWITVGPVPKLGEARLSLWKFRTGFWPAEGLTGKQAESNERVDFAMETLFVEWTIRNAVHLPTDKVLFQLGDHQICLYDPITRRIALVTKGRGPIAVMADDPEKATTTHESKVATKPSTWPNEKHGSKKR